MASVLTRAGGRTFYIYECPKCQKRVDEQGRSVEPQDATPGKDDAGR